MQIIQHSSFAYYGQYNKYQLNLLSWASISFYFLFITRLMITGIIFAARNKQKKELTHSIHWVAHQHNSSNSCCTESAFLLTKQLNNVGWFVCLLFVIHFINWNSTLWIYISVVIVILLLILNLGFQFQLLHKKFLYLS